MDHKNNEINQLNIQCNELIEEQEIVLGEINEPEQQCTDIKDHRDSTYQENNDFQETVRKDQHQHEEVVKELKEAVACVESSNELKNINKAHDADMEECKLNWSEHDSVCNELKKLSEDLSLTFNKNVSLECEIKSCWDEIKTLQLNNELLKHEVSLALHDRDKALVKCNDFKKKFGLDTDENEACSQLNSGSNRKSENQNNSLEQVAPLDTFGSVDKEYMDKLDQANQEVEHLRKIAEKYHDELFRTLEIAEASKAHCERALNERDKLILDREKMRNLCDGLRKQCDDSFNKLALAINYCDDKASQKSDNAEEYNDLKEEMESQLENTCSLQFQATSSHNQDSVSDNDLEDSDTEILNIDLGALDSNEDLGIDLSGGRDDPWYPNDDAIYVSSVTEGSLAATKLRVHDCILEMNGLDCSSISKKLVMETMRTLNNATLVVRRKKSDLPSTSLFTTKSQSKNYIDHGITLETGIYIKKITPGSMADKVGNLDVGDRVLSINKTTLENIKNSKEAMSLLHKPVDVLTIKAIKSACFTENTVSEPSYDVFKESNNFTTQTENSSDLRHKEAYPEPPTERGPFDVFETAPRGHSPINYDLDLDEEEEIFSESSSVTDEFSPYPTPTGSPINNPPGRYSHPNIHPRVPSYTSNNRYYGAPGTSRRVDTSVSKEKDSSTSYTVEFLDSDHAPADRRQSLPAYKNYIRARRLNDLRPLPGDLRFITIKKSCDPLGIQILTLETGALFVAAVSKHCVAYNVGLQVGDRLLEVNGVNLRRTTYQNAATVLKDCGNTVTILVKYTPDKMFLHN